jgi:DNA processing protein
VTGVDRLAGGRDRDLLTTVLRCATSSWVTPERLGAVLARRLGRNASTDVAAVIAELAQPPPGALPVTGAQVEAAALALLEQQARVLAVGRHGYPEQLAHAWPELGAPAWLFVRGRAPLPVGPAVAVVGTRRPTIDGLRTARALGTFLARAGVTVVSGLARGIDQAAHLGALDAGGATVAVLGTGLGVDYPARTGGLRDAIADAGGLVTEFAAGAPPLPHQFLQRNRIISGLVSALVVVEGRERSGALQTARLAAAQGRDVFAVPGSLNAPASRGPLALIRDGARVLTCFDDVLETLDPGLTTPGPAAPQRAPVSNPLLDLLGPQPASAAALAEAADLPLQRVLAQLADLEAQGHARHTTRGFIATGQ